MNPVSRLKPLLKNQYVVFTLVRYTSYFLQFLRGFIIAKILGPELFGIWGLILIYYQYLSLSTLGVQYALNTELALNMEAEEKVKSNIISSSFLVVGLMAILLFSSAGIAYTFGLDEFLVSAQLTPLFILLLLGVIALQNFQQLYNNVFRVNQQLMLICFSELLVASMTLSIAFFFTGIDLITAYLVVWAGSLLLVNLVFSLRRKFSFVWINSGEMMWQLVLAGIPLLIYNFAFQLMVLASRTIVGAYYPLEILGFYSLAHAVSSAVLLGLDAIGWLFFPRVIAKVKEGIETEEVLNSIRKISQIFTSAALVLIFGTILVSPLIFLYLPEYKQVSHALQIMLLTQGVFAPSFCFVSLVIARRRHAMIAFIAMFSCLIVTLIGILAAENGLEFIYLAIASFIGSLVFSYVSIRTGLSMLGISSSKMSEFFPLSVVLSIAMFFAGTFSPHSYLLFIVSFALFLWLNRKSLRNLLEFIKMHLGRTP